MVHEAYMMCSRATIDASAAEDNNLILTQSAMLPNQYAMFHQYKLTLGFLGYSRQCCNVGSVILYIICADVNMNDVDMKKLTPSNILEQRREKSNETGRYVPESV